MSQHKHGTEVAARKHAVDNAEPHSQKAEEGRRRIRKETAIRNLTTQMGKHNTGGTKTGNIVETYDNIKFRQARHKEGVKFWRQRKLVDAELEPENDFMAGMTRDEREDPEHRRRRMHKLSQLVFAKPSRHVPLPFTLGENTVAVERKMHRKKLKAVKSVVDHSTPHSTTCARSQASHARKREALRAARGSPAKGEKRRVRGVPALTEHSWSLPEIGRSRWQKQATLSESTGRKGLTSSNEGSKSWTGSGMNRRRLEVARAADEQAKQEGAASPGSEAAVAEAEASTEAELRRVFEMLDRERVGQITRVALRMAITALSEDLSPAEVDALIAGEDASGGIDFTRFHKMMTGAQPTPAQASPQVEDPTLRAAMTEARKHPSVQPQPGTAAYVEAQLSLVRAGGSYNATAINGRPSTDNNFALHDSADRPTEIPRRGRADGVSGGRPLGFSTVGLVNDEHSGLTPGSQVLPV